MISCYLCQTEKRELISSTEELLDKRYYLWKCFLRFKKWSHLIFRNKIVSILEGGYNLAAIQESAKYHVEALLEV